MESTGADKASILQVYVGKKPAVGVGCADTYEFVAFLYLHSGISVREDPLEMLP